MAAPLVIRAYEPLDEDGVVALWRECGLVAPQNDPVKDIQRKLAMQPELFLVGECDKCVVGTVMAGYEGHRGWVNYVAVRPGEQRQGIGRELMAAAEGLLRARGCPKINLQVRATNHAVVAFYESLGFKQDAVISLGKRLVFDEPPERVK